MAFLDNTGLEYVWQKLKALLAGKVDKVEGKGLSTFDLTAALKSNYDAAYAHSQAAHAPSTAEKNSIVGVQVNGSDLTPDSSRKVNVAVPTGALADKDEVTETDLNAALREKVNAASEGNHSHLNKAVLDLIEQADLDKLDAIPTPSSLATQTYVAQQVAAAGHLKKAIVDELPSASEAAENTIYMVPKTSASGDQSYDEYMKINDALEKIGDTQTVVEAITTGEIDTIFAS